MPDRNRSTRRSFRMGRQTNVIIEHFLKRGNERLKGDKKKAKVKQMRI